MIFRSPKTNKGDVAWALRSWGHRGIYLHDGGKCALCSYLCGKNDERYANHDDHVQLRRPNIWHEVAVPDCRERHHHVVRGLKETQMTMACPLEMLYTAYAANTQRDTAA